MLLKVKEANYVADYKIKLLFSDGVTKTVDLLNELDLPVFIPLKDLSLFKQFVVKFNTIEWTNEVDIAPEYLYEIGHRDQ